MVEREEPERAPGAHDSAEHPAGADRQDDRAGGNGEAGAAPEPTTAGEGAELIDNHESDSAADAAAGSTAADAGDGAARDTRADDRTGAELDHTGAEAGPATSEELAGATVLDFKQRPGVTDEDTEQATAEGLIDADELGAEPLNLAEIQADDALLDALGGTNPSVSADSDGAAAPALETLLVAWRREVDAAPIGDLVDLDEATAAIAAGQRPRRRSRRRHLVPVASAAAVLMIGFTGVGLAARDALPGDMLWGVAQVLYSDHTSAIKAAAAARTDLATAEEALDAGRRADAYEALLRAREQMRAVDAEHGLSELQAAHESLQARYQDWPDQSEAPTSESDTSTHQSAPVTTTPPQLPPPNEPSQPPGPTVPPSSSVPSSSQEPTTSPSWPSETSGTSDHPSSGTTGGGTPSDPGGGLFAPSN